MGGTGLVALEPEHHAKAFGGVHVVIDDKDTRKSRGTGACRRFGGFGLSGRHVRRIGGAGQAYDELAAFTGTGAECFHHPAVQLRQSVALDQAEVYRLQFWAKADTPRTLQFKTIQNDSVPLGAGWQHYLIYFQGTATDAAGELNFYFGDRIGATWLDGVVLQGTAR